MRFYYQDGICAHGDATILELFLHGRSRITDLADGALQFLLGDSKKFGLVRDLKSLIHRNLRSVRQAAH
jgi:hypothetical protein